MQRPLLCSLKKNCLSFRLFFNPFFSFPQKVGLGGKVSPSYQRGVAVPPPFAPSAPAFDIIYYVFNIILKYNIKSIRTWTNLCSCYSCRWSALRNHVLQWWCAQSRLHNLVGQRCSKWPTIEKFQNLKIHRYTSYLYAINNIPQMITKHIIFYSTETSQLTILQE